MASPTAFFAQPAKRYRNFQLVFTLLTLNFALPAVSYAVAPEIAQEQFARIEALLGGEPYTFNEAGSRVWRYLGAANVATLALMCLLLQLDLRRNYRMLIPLTFLKGYNASLYLLGFAADPAHRAFLAVGLFDALTCVAFVYFARTARAEIEGRPDAELVPRPLGSK